MERLLSNIQNKRKNNSSVVNNRCLLLLDGHGTRNQRHIWEKMNNADVDVLCLPSHTSNFTQPLDLCVNAQFKKCLQNVPNFPSKSQINEKLPNFISCICDRMYASLMPEFIRKGFPFE
jgi:hypothetical protein